MNRQQRRAKRAEKIKPQTFAEYLLDTLEAYTSEKALDFTEEEARAIVQFVDYADKRYGLEKQKNPLKVSNA